MCLRGVVQGEAPTPPEGGPCVKVDFGAPSPVNYSGTLRALVQLPQIQRSWEIEQKAVVFPWPLLARVFLSLLTLPWLLSSSTDFPRARGWDRGCQPADWNVCGLRWARWAVSSSDYTQWQWQDFYAGKSRGAGGS